VEELDSPDAARRRWPGCAVARAVSAPGPDAGQTGQGQMRARRDRVRTANPLECLIHTRISKDRAGDAHGVANQLADVENGRRSGWTVTHRLSDNDIGVTPQGPEVRRAFPAGV